MDLIPHLLKDVFALMMKESIVWKRALVRSKTLPRTGLNAYAVHCTEIDTAFSPKFQDMKIGVLYKPSDGQYPFADLMMKIDDFTIVFYQASIGKSHPKSIFTFCKVKESLGITGGVKEVKNKVGNETVSVVVIEQPATVKFHMHYLIRPEYAQDVSGKVQTDSFFWDAVTKNAKWNVLAEDEIDFYVLTWPGNMDQKF